MRSTAWRSAALPVILATLVACAPGEPGDVESTDPEPSAATDAWPHSYARPDEIAVEHLTLDLDVDFEARQLIGRATLRLDRRDSAATTLYLDARGLDIRGASTAATLDGEAAETTFRLGDEVELLGQELAIDLPEGARFVHVDYASSPDAAAVQWLEPRQTAGGEHPFLFTQSQAILARTWVPIQDTPAVRFPYDATIRVPSELMAIMSAENPTERTDDGVYRFTMPQPIPSYLLALAVGDLEFRSVGARTGVYAEPATVEASAYEFGETEAMIEVVEPLFGPYRWGRYDMLVLPPSFPFGGMENPRLTFLTPTILAGDRSLVALIAHELAHSWSGNLVTNATWDDFWLNEGFTVYLERRIMEAHPSYGPDYTNMLAVLGRQDLGGTLTEEAEHDTHLRLALTGRDPDDGMTDVAYEKGALFLRTIEMTVGRERFDPFLRSWFDENAFESKSTDEFVAFLRERLVGDDDALWEQLQIDAWVDGPGIPGNAAEPESAAFTTVDEQRAAWLAGELAVTDLPADTWTTHHWLHFIRGLPEGLDLAKMDELDGQFDLTSSGNSEILHAWFHHVVESRYETGYDALRDFLQRQGRRKFLQPLYERMAGHEDLMPMAQEIYATARPGYHSVSTNTIDEILGVSGDGDA
ncbi:MAG: M1 family metallopeptidase [Acidobacteriota bacterium]